MKYVNYLIAVLLMIASPDSAVVAAESGKELGAETIIISQSEPWDVDYSSCKIVVPRSAIKGDGIWVSVIGGVREPGIYFIERGSTVADFLRKITYYPGAIRTGLLVINNKAGTRVEFRAKEGSQRELEISISHWLLNEGDVVFVLEIVK